MGDYDDDDIIYPKYKWRVTLETDPVTISIEANTAEEAMTIAENNYELKTLPLDSLPEMHSVSARITGVTEEFAEIMRKEVK